MANNMIKGQEEEIDLLKLLQALWHSAWVIVATALVGGVIFLVYTMFFITPQYNSSALLYVNNGINVGSAKLSITSSDLYASNSLVETFSVILKSRNTLDAVIEDGQIPYSYEELVTKVSGGAEGDTPVFKITVTDKDPDMAARIANDIVEVIVDRISEIVEGSSVKVVDYAIPARNASSPSYTKNTAIGMLIGFVIACGIIILRCLMDTTIREEEFLLENYKDIPVLATIPDLSQQSSGGYYGSYSKSYSKSFDKAKAKAQTQQAPAKARPRAADPDLDDSPFVTDGSKRPGSEG
ncbi:MAG: hypothetical protein IKE53_05060 [Clostridiales bacterium]|nr:hypothetical protein [Clostridiales bacterium]